jgi:hypothetical protein
MTTMLDRLERRDARRIINSLGQSGQPPKLGASYLNVGTQTILEQLRKEYLEDFLTPFEGQDGEGTCKWVEANYGNGKTQFLRCMQEQAWDLGYVTAFVELSQNECPLDQPHLVYGAVARSVQARPLQAADVDRKGLDIALEQLIDRKFEGVLSGLPNDDLQDQARAWVNNTLATTSVECSAFRSSCLKFLLAKLQGDSQVTELIAPYLRGEPSAMPELKKIGILEKIDKSSGFRFLRSLCQLIQRSGLGTGTILLFDETGDILSLMSSKAKKAACENLLTVINRCNNGELPGTMFMYGVMPDFFTGFATDYPALQQRCGRGTRINLEILEGIKEIDLLRQIGEKITAVFQIAFEDAPKDYEILERNLKTVADQVLKQALVGSGTRRLLVKTWVQALQTFREGGLRALSKDDVDRMIQGAKEELVAIEKGHVDSEGE